MVARSVYAADFAVVCWVRAHISLWVCWVDCTLSTAVSYDWDEQLTLMLGCVAMCRTSLLRLRTMTWMLLLNSQWKTDEEWVQLFIFPVCFANIIRSFHDELYANCFIDLTRHFTVIGFRDIRIVIVIVASRLIAVIKWSYNVIICFWICPITSSQKFEMFQKFFCQCLGHVATGPVGWSCWLYNDWCDPWPVLWMPWCDHHASRCTHSPLQVCYRCAVEMIADSDGWWQIWCCRVLRECSHARETKHYRLWWRSLWKLRCVAFVWRLPVSPCAVLLSLTTQEHK